MKNISKRILSAVLTLGVLASLCVPAFAAVSYMPDVTAEMSDADFWASRSGDPDAVMMTREEIKAQNADTAIASGTSVMDLRTAAETFDGLARNKAIRSSATADAEYYFGWTYGPDGKKADWRYYQKMIDNCADPSARKAQKTRYGICVNRTVLKVFPSDNPIWDDPAASAIAFLSELGVMRGYSEETFAPQDTLTREQLCMVFYRFINVQNLYLGAISLDDLSAYADRAKVSADAKDAMSWMVGSGLLSGSAGNRLAPKEAVTRAQLAVILQRYDHLKTTAAEAAKQAQVVELPLSDTLAPVVSAEEAVVVTP